MTILDNYEKIYKKYISEDGLAYQRSYKISGNIFAYLLRGYIAEILKDKYELSVVNSFIEGEKTEWDLLIVKNPSVEEKKLNIYKPEHVVCAIEFKTSGAIFKNDPLASKEYLQSYITILNKLNIQYAYISLCEIPGNLNAMKRNYPDNCFWLIEGYYGDRDKENVKKNDLEELKIFLNKLIKL